MRAIVCEFVTVDGVARAPSGPDEDPSADSQRSKVVQQRIGEIQGHQRTTAFAAVL